MSRSARETARQAFRISQVIVMDQARLAISHLGFACCIQVFNLLNVISCGNFVRSSMPIFVWARISFAEQWEKSIAFSMVRVCANWVQIFLRLSTGNSFCARQALQVNILTWSRLRELYHGIVIEWLCVLCVCLCVCVFNFACDFPRQVFEIHFQAWESLKRPYNGLPLWTQPNIQVTPKPLTSHTPFIFSLNFLLSIFWKGRW